MGKKSLEIFDANEKKAKVCKKIAPVVFWVCIALSIVLLVLCVRNSIGNFIEMTQMLDKKTHTGEQLRANYNLLLQRYGEWVIGGTNGFEITFINIGKVLFNGISILCGFCSIAMFISAFVFGKWFLPAYAEQIKEDNQSMTNRAVLKNLDDKE